MKLTSPRRSLCYLKWTLKRLMTLLIGVIWILLWDACLFHLCGESGLENMSIQPQLLYQSMTTLQTNFVTFVNSLFMQEANPVLVLYIFFTFVNSLFMQEANPTQQSFFFFFFHLNEKSINLTLVCTNYECRWYNSVTFIKSVHINLVY